MPKNPIDYANGLQYKIVCKDPAITDCYNGSTCSLKDRKSEHKKRCNNPNSDKYNFKVYRFIREHGGWDNWTMIQLELYPCNSKPELVLRERHWFDLLKPTMNTYSPMTTPEERKESVKQNNKEYYANHIEEEKKRCNEYNATHREERKIYEAKYNSTQERKKSCAKYNATHREERKKYNAEYDATHMEENKKRYAEYNANHREEKLAKQKVKINCECGCIITKHVLSKHQRTQKHLAIIAQNQ